MLYVLICVSLALVGVAGLQFLYLIYLNKLSGARRNSISDLERRNKILLNRVEAAELEIANQNKRLRSASDETEEIWADVIDER